MGTNLSAPKKERNYIIDVFKIIATIACVAAHFAQLSGALFGVGATASFGSTLLSFSYLYHTSVPMFGCTGYVTVAFFTFTTGYWFMNAFQRTKKQGVFGKGKDGTILFRYWARNYATYIPYIMFGTISMMIFIYAMTPELRTNVKSFLGSFMMALPQIFGFEAYGFFDCQAGTNSVLMASQLTGGFVDLPMSSVWFEWDSAFWYMYGILAWFPLVYYVFLKDEKFGLAVFCPVVFYVYICVYHMGAFSWNFYQYDPCFFRLVGPASLGIVGWYIVNALKKHNFTKGETNLLTFASVASLAVYIYGTITSIGGYPLLDYSCAVFLCTVLIGKDAFTPKLNKVCKYFPCVKHANTISLWLYLSHSPILYWLVWAVNDSRYAAMTEWMKGFDYQVLFLMFIAAELVVCVPFYYFEKAVLKPFSDWILKVSKANEPVIVAEEAKVA